MYIIAQIFGILVAVTCLIAPFFKTKRQIMAILLLGNTCASLNFLILNGFGSACIINIVAVVHVFINIIHEQFKTEAGKLEKIIFMVLYVGCGFLNFKKAIDLLPIIAALFFMLAVFQKKEQNIRLFNICNAVTWIIFDFIIGSSAILAQLISIVSNTSAFIKYRKEQ